ncbi:hypothetical protein P7C71_g5500, partial [Lecanoromycetidae sp. Uapishka_2]
MSGAQSRLSKLASHFLSSSPSTEFQHRHNIHTLSPTFFLPRAAAVEPNAEAIYHVTANGKILRRSYQEAADRARGLAYYIKKHGYRKVGILCPNTPAFLESIYGIAAAGAVNVGVNYRLKHEDITYIFGHADVEAIIVDAEFVPLLEGFRKGHPNIPFIVDADTDASEGELSGQFDDAVFEGLEYDAKNGHHGWDGLEAQVQNEEDVIALAYTSGTTAKPKGVEFTHRGAYVAALGNVIESGLGYHTGRCRYLWTLPMFHAMGWTYPWAVTAVRGTHYCLRKIDYPEIWRLLKEEHITHYCAAPTVNTLLCVSEEAEALSEPRQALDKADMTVGGENISSVALESMLATHPDILEAAVVAVADSHWGERPKAFITVQTGKDLRGEDVIEWAKHNSGISRFMVPREVEIVEELPKTSTGKLKKNVLRDWAKGADRSLAT